jgi:hypothetical protein
MVQICEEETLEWERTRTVHPDSDADSDPAQEATGQKLVEALEEIFAENEAAERMDTAGSQAGHQSALPGQGQVAAMCLQHLPMADGARARVPLRLLRRPRGGGGRGEVKETSQGIADEGAQEHRASQRVHRLALTQGVWTQSTALLSA